MMWVLPLPLQHLEVQGGIVYGASTRSPLFFHCARMWDDSSRVFLPDHFGNVKLPEINQFGRQCLFKKIVTVGVLRHHFLKVYSPVHDPMVDWQSRPAGFELMNGRSIVPWCLIITFYPKWQGQFPMGDVSIQNVDLTLKHWVWYGIYPLVII